MLLLGMKLKQTVLAMFAIVMMAVGTVAVLQPSVSMADCKPDKSKGTQCCGGAETSIISCDQNSSKPGSAKQSAVWSLLTMALKILTAGVGIAAVGGIVYGAILFASARDSAEQVKKAIGIITNVAIGIVAYGLMFLILNFLIPGGIFS